eukprot:158541-Chlamydomonas_euryale.AAC.2
MAGWAWLGRNGWAWLGRKAARMRLSALRRRLPASGEWGAVRELPSTRSGLPAAVSGKAAATTGVQGLQFLTADSFSLAVVQGLQNWHPACHVWGVVREGGALVVEVKGRLFGVEGRLLGAVHAVAACLASFGVHRQASMRRAALPPPPRRARVCARCAMTHGLHMWARWSSAASRLARSMRNQRTQAWAPCAGHRAAAAVGPGAAVGRAAAVTVRPVDRAHQHWLQGRPHPQRQLP